nr:synaptobrevin, longin-like domain protein [Tanacetum cinerariifolium]
MEKQKILAKVNGRQRTISESSIRRHLKLNDEEGISTLPDNELFENLSLMGYNILPNQRFSFQKGQLLHQWKFLIHTIMQCLSPKSTSFNEFSSSIVTALVFLATNRTYNFSKMIFDGMMRNVKSKDKFLMYPRVKTLEDNEKRREGFAHEDAPNTRDGSRGEFLVGDTMQDIDKSADKGSDNTNDMANVLGTIGATNILAFGGLRSVFTTASLSVATTSTFVSLVIATASGSFPIVAIFTTARVATHPTRVTRSSRGVVIEYSSLISVNIPSISKKDKRKGKMIDVEQPSKENVLEQMSAQLARDLESKFAQEDQIIREQAKRDSERVRIHAERELEIMITKLDKSNKIVAKYLSEYEQAEAGLSRDEKVELINELLMYQWNLAQIKKYQAQQNKPATKTKRRDFYMSILRSNAGWKAKDFKGMTLSRLKKNSFQFGKRCKILYL